MPTTYDAFISYSHAADGKLAPALQNALQRFAKPWYRLRALHLFRDQTSLSATPGLWPAIEQALTNSRYFLLLASPEAAASRWVQQEVAWWLEHKSPQTLLIALTDGKIVRHPGAKDFDWSEAGTTALPPTLKGVFVENPLWVDFRLAKGQEHLSTKNPEFQNVLAALAAPLRNIPKENLIGEDVRQHRRALLLARGAALVLVVLLIAAIGAAFFARSQQVEAETQRDEAQRQTTIALARALASEVPGQIETLEEERAALLARQAYAYNDVIAGPVRARVDDAMRAVMSVPHFSRILRGHEGHVAAMAFNPEGTMLASGGMEGRIQLWDLSRPDSAPRTLSGHTDWVVSLALNADSTRLVSTSRDGKVLLWDLQQPEADPVLLRGYGNWLPVSSLAFSPDGTILAASGVEDGAPLVLLRNVRRLEDEPVVIEGGDDRITSFMFTPTGDSLAVGTTDGTVRFYSLSMTLDTGKSYQSGDRVVSLDLGAPIDRIAFSPDGETVALVVDQRIQLRNLARPSEGPIELPTEIGSVDGLAFSPDGRLLASANGLSPAPFADGTATLWDLNQLDADPVILQGQGEAIESVAFAPDGLTLATGGEDGSVRLWDLREPVAIPGGLDIDDHPADSVAFSPDGKLLASAGGYNPVGASHGSVSLWNLEKKTRAAVLSLDIVPISLVFSPDGNTLAWYALKGGEEPAIWLWSPGPTDQLEAAEHADPIVLQHPDGIGELAFSPDGKWLASGGDGMVRLWDPGNPETAPVALHIEVGTPVAQSDPFANHVVSVAFSPDGKWLAGGSQDGTIRLWDLDHPDSAPIGLPGQPGRVNDLAFSPDGTTVASSSSDASVRLWDVSRPTSDPVVLPHDQATSEVAFSVDGRTLATASIDGMVRLWDAAQPTVPSVLRGHGGAPVGSVAFSPDGKSLVSGSGKLGGAGGTIRFWMTTEALAAAICERVGRNLTQSEWNLFVGQGVPYERTCTDFPTDDPVTTTLAPISTPAITAASPQPARAASSPALPLAATSVAVPENPTEVYVAHVYAGTCTELGSPVEPLADLMLWPSPALNPRSLPLGVATTVLSEALADITGGGHVIGVADPAEPSVVVACGQIAGAPDAQGDLFNALWPGSGSSDGGVA